MVPESILCHISNNRVNIMRQPKEIVEQLLELRGITGEEQIAEFLSAKPQMAHDPFLLLNMKEGVDLILSEIEKGTKICIYGDYDADGVTSICVLEGFIKKLTDNVTHYIPSRFTDGYGLNIDAIRRIKEDGTGLIITVDCGSVSKDEVAFAKSQGLKIVVTDHHTVDKVKADCILINPKQKECKYPFKELAGCGVAFKLAQAIRIRKNMPRELLNSFLDLVAIGTIADIVPLKDENRTMVKYGLSMINRRTRMSINKLAEGISLNHIYSENVSFGIAPHINAVGRMGSAEEAVRLFMAEDEDTAVSQTEILKESNRLRKEEQNKAYDNCTAMLTGDEDFIVIVRNDIHEGIGGIVAGKIKEQYNRPCIIITPASDGRLKGTGRSIEKIDLHSFLKEYDYIFDTFGGHKGACGFTMGQDKLKDFIELTESKIKRMKMENPDIFKIDRRFDMEIVPEEVSLELYDSIKSMEPFGNENEQPKFAITNIMLTNCRKLGSEGQHLKCSIIDRNGRSIDCIIFNRADEFMEVIDSGEPLSVIATVGANTWNGATNVQLRLEDIYAC